MKLIILLLYYNQSYLIKINEIQEWNFNKIKKTPLHFAAENDSIKIGELLISKGADINSKNIIYQITEMIIFNHYETN